MRGADFWSKLDELVATGRIVVDRSAGTTHPRYPSYVYPLDYGYLEGTQGGDGDGVDVWIGSQPERIVTAIVCAVDVEQLVAELKVLVGCTKQEAAAILGNHNVGSQSAVLVERNRSDSSAPKLAERIQEAEG
jgi:inorganic pyrophosphatase